MSSEEPSPSHSTPDSPNITSPLHFQTGHRNTGIPSAILGVVLLWIGFLITMILIRGSDVGTPSGESQALIRSSERMLQMAQWTIASVLTIGGALIGFNWFQNQRDREDIRVAQKEVSILVESTPDQIADLEFRINERLSVLEGVIVFSSDATMGIQMLDEARSLSHPMAPTANHFVGLFVNGGENFRKKRTAMQLIAFTLDRQLEQGGLDEHDIRAVQAVIPDLWLFDQPLAHQIVTTLQRIQRSEQNDTVNARESNSV